MKELIAAFVLFTIIVPVNAQKNFQGEITYRFRSISNFEAKEDAEVKVLFGVQKLKLQFKEKEDSHLAELLVLLDSSAIYSVNRNAKTFSKKQLVLSSRTVRPAKKSFCGYGGTLMQLDNNAIGALLIGMSGSSNTFLYVSDSLFFNVTEAIASNIELSMLKNNKIVLAAELEMKNDFEKPIATADTINKRIMIEAIAIQPMIVNDTEFTIPSNYENTTVELSVIAEAEEVVLDTIVLPPIRAKKPLKKKSSGSGKTKTVNKTSAIRNKQ